MKTFNAKKLDGSMIAPMVCNGRLYWATKKSFDSTASVACTQYVNSTELPYQQFCLEWIEKGYTPLFEWCSKANPIL